jgi:hypothetical protein
LQPFDFLFSRGGLGRPRARAESRDKILQLRDFLFALRVFRLRERTEVLAITMSS